MSEYVIRPRPSWGPKVRATTGDPEPVCFQSSKPSSAVEESHHCSVTPSANTASDETFTGSWNGSRTEDVVCVYGDAPPSSTARMRNRYDTASSRSLTVYDC